ncbi:MAG: hypothetical protein EXQ89_02885 [Rhodospirillaceae bacterium]|nr:hypothetical protein [Rhodospirillaceae bacterium]
MSRCACARLARATHEGNPNQDSFVRQGPLGTRSGKEILAHGFKCYGMGAVIGTRRAGAVRAGRAFLLPDNSLHLRAVSDALVDGARLEGWGVAPTIEVPFRLEYSDGADPELDRAVETLARTGRDQGN